MYETNKPRDTILSRKDTSMKKVKTMQRYKCDFCNKRSIKSAMERHEKICYRNPDRFCELCQNTGEVDEGIEHYSNMQPCHWCSKFDKEMLKQIEAREKEEKQEFEWKDTS